MQTLILVVHLTIAIVIIGFVLLQQGKGSEAGASFGAGASATVFGSHGSATFLGKLTAYLAVIFFATSIALGYFIRPKEAEVNLNLDIPQVVKDIPLNSDIPSVNTVNSTAIISTDDSSTEFTSEESNTDIIEAPTNQAQ